MLIIYYFRWIKTGSLEKAILSADFIAAINNICPSTNTALWKN